MVLPLHHDSGGRKALPEQPLPGALGLTLVRGRVHELCGAARVSLAALILAASEGPVIWISPGWLLERVYPPGLRDMADPGRIIFARARRPEDLLWAMEEALRSGAAPIVLGDLPARPALTPIRRLHLACEAGADAARHRGRLAPLGLILTPGKGGPLADGRRTQRINPSGKPQRLGHAAAARPHGPTRRVEPDQRCCGPHQCCRPALTGEW
jgi:protein ImuA